MGDVIVVIGAGQIGQAIARRVSAGKHVVLADLHQGNADAATEVLADAGFEVSTAAVDVSSRESVHALAQTATAIGDVTGVIHAAGVSPSQAKPGVILAVDLYGTALVPTVASQRPTSSGNSRLNDLSQIGDTHGHLSRRSHGQGTG
jgi:NAD(P)-dependent dehydrogenase (short-subunit alcohol dehydrogenase family)